MQSSVSKTIEKNFNSCPFKLNIPKIDVLKSKLRLSIPIIFDRQCTDGIVLKCVEIRERNLKPILFEFDNYFIEVQVDDYLIEVELNKSISRNALNNSLINLIFLTSKGKKIKVEYKINKELVLHFEHVEIVEEKLENIITFNSVQKNKNLHSKDSILENGFSKLTLNEYKKKIYQEMCYLKDAGGRKYRATNGEYIEKMHNMYAYSFELESELYLSDDAPITIIISDVNIKGTVLMCEGFQIIILSERDLGKNVSLAFITVDPWKLLQALYKKLDLLTSKDKLAVKILTNDSPIEILKSIEDIPMGQEKAIQKALSEDITVIWGPPGTGKTYTMAQIAMNFLSQGKSVLMVSQSNISVDGLINELVEQINKINSELNGKFLKNGKILRYGYVREKKLSMNDEAVSFNYVLKQNKSLKDFRESLIKEKENKNTSKNRLVEIEKQLKTIKTKIKEKEHEYVKNAKLIATTISKVSIDPLFDERKFDVVMFDEVSMAYVPQVIFAASLAKEHFICVGDFKQLAPIAQSEAKKYLCRDIFYHLGINENDGQPHYHPWLVMLNEQRRMYPDISNFSNRYIYKGLLKDYYNVAHLRKHIVAKGPFNNKSMNIIDLTGTQCIAGKNNDNSRFNILSAIIAFGTALEALKNKQKRVGIITPYSAQSRLIHAMTIDYGKELSTKLACSTVHQFQGSEREVIIFDSVESYPSNKPGWLMSKNENDSLVRLINVAVTRAKGKLITIANSNFWTKKFQNSNNTYYLLVKHIMNYHNVIDNKNHILGQYLANIDYGKNIKSFNDINKAIEQLLNDLSNTEQQIIVSIPDGHLNDEYQDVIINKLFWLKKKGIDILMKSNDYISLPRKWKELSFSDELNGFPLILIDNKLIWYGLPISRGALKDGDSYYHTTLQTIYRIKGMHTVELIKSLTEIENRFNDGVKKKLYSREKDNEVQIDNVTHKQFDGIGLYIRKNEFCLNCKSPMVLAKGRSGKPYIKCSKCKETSILSVDTVNQYILEKNIKCPQHNCHIYAKVGPYGLYVKCDKDHTVKVEEI